MKYKKIITLAMLLASSSIHAALGCISRSFYEQKDKFYARLDPSLRDGLEVYRNENDYPSDPKAWHHVWCTCHCNEYLVDYHSTKIDSGGLCPKCHHRGPVGRSAGKPGGIQLSQKKRVD